MNLRDSAQQVFDREVWNNHLVLLNSRHAVLCFNTHSDRGRRKGASGLFKSKSRVGKERGVGEEGRSPAVQASATAGRICENHKLRAHLAVCKSKRLQKG